MRTDDPKTARIARAVVVCGASDYYSMSENQCTADVMMIRPASFCANLQTASTNRFQNVELNSATANDAAAQELDRLAKALSDAGARVHLFNDTPEPVTPDALFPNNWVSFHADATTALYPMLAPNRRQERRFDILESLSASGFRTQRIVDLTTNELDGIFLEGTGSLVLDRVNRIAYAGISPRTHLEALGEFAQQLDYDLVAFETADPSGTPIYHTNVLMSIGREFAVVCTDAIHPSHRARVLETIENTGHGVLEISQEQMANFAGNILELNSARGGYFVIMSERARASFLPDQLRKLNVLSGGIVASPIPTIENLGGGSVRCMLAEIHLPRAERA
jgi:hypothetical protein